jgi:MSHA biogenesis protein MshN
MSLINKMLQDLEARQPADGVGLALPNEVRPLPPLENRLPAALLVVLLTLLGTGFALRHWGVRVRIAETPAALPIRPAVQPLPSVAPKIPPPPGEAKALSELLSSRAEDSRFFLPLMDIEASLRVSDSLNANGEKKTERPSGGKAASGGPGPVPVVRPPHSEVAGRKPSAAAPAPKASSSILAPMIERTDVLGTARERADVDYRKAIAAVNLGRMNEALEGLRNALKQDGQHRAARQLLVKLLLEMKRPDEAMQALREGVQEQPAHLGWAMMLARLQVDRGDLAGAWQTLESALPVAGSSADFQGFAAHVLQRLGRNNEAAERYLAAIELSPREGRWWFGLGLAFEAEGRSAEAREVFVRARQCGNLSAELNTLLDQKLR